MPWSLVNRSEQCQALRGLLRASFGWTRGLTTAAQNPSAPPSPAPSNSKPKRKKKKNLFEVAQFLPNWGLGYHMAKTHWANVSYEITKINLYKDGRHGKAWGIVHKDGLKAADAPKKISGVHKRCWRYIPQLSKPAESGPILAQTIKSAPSAEAQAASTA